MDRTPLGGRLDGLYLEKRSLEEFGGSRFVPFIVEYGAGAGAEIGLLFRACSIQQEAGKQEYCANQDFFHSMQRYG